MIWYGGQFYARVFLVNTLKVPANAADIALIVALALATAGFVFFGWLSDKIGPQADHPGRLLARCVNLSLRIRQSLPTPPNPALEKAWKTRR